MIHMQNIKTVQLLAPQSVGTTAVSGTADCSGYDHARITWLLPAAAASNVPLTMNVVEYDSTSSTSIIAVLNPIDTDNGYTLPAPDTATNQIVVNDIDLRGRKRYLKVNFAQTATRVAACLLQLSRAETAPSSATEAGATVWVKV